MCTHDRKVSDKVLRWDHEESGESIYNDLHALITFRARISYDEYHPSIGPNAAFDERLLAWLNSSADEDFQRLMFKFIPHIFYIGSEEFVSLYQSAMNEHIIPWLIDLEQLDIADPTIDDLLQEALKKVWFCPVTDSMHISDFYHINNITSLANFRPDWFSLCKFSSPEKIHAFMSEKGLSYLVLLEDFVGTGSQVLGKGSSSDIRHITDGVLGFVGREFTQIQTLVLPLICCPKGSERFSKLEAEYKNIKCETLISIPHHMMINSDTLTNEDSSSFFKEFSKALNKVNSLYNWTDGPFGFLNTGSLIVMYSNCPNNTLPFIYQRTENWEPLFPRSSRL